MRTSDNGSNWRVASSGLPFPALIQALAVDPRRARYAYAFTGRGLYRTQNSGLTWTRTSLRAKTHIAASEPIAVDPTQSKHVYAAVAARLHMSNDRGKHWRRTGPRNAGRINAITVDPTSSRTIYLATERGLFRSANRGGRWSKLGIDEDVRRLAVDPSAPRRLYALAGNANVFKSTDAGRSWRKMNAGSSVSGSISHRSRLTRAGQDTSTSAAPGAASEAVGSSSTPATPSGDGRISPEPSRCQASST